VPNIFVGILSISYRYIFLILEIAENIFLAKKMRTITTDTKKEQHWIGSTVGIAVSSIDLEIQKGESIAIIGAKASILVIEPTVILLDEPTNGLDPRSVRELLQLIKGLINTNKTVVTATHNLEIIPEIASKVYVLGENKKIIKVGTPEEILSDRKFLSENNLV